MKVIGRSATAGAISIFLLLVAIDRAAATTAFGHRSDPEACLTPSDKKTEDMIAACWKALNSHMLTRHGVAFALNNLAIAYRQKEDWDSALNAITAAIKLEGDVWQALVNRAGIYDHLAKPDLAIADLDRAVAVNSSQPICFRLRGEFYLRQQKFDLAAADFTRAVLLDSRDAKSLFLRSIARQHLGDSSGAAADLSLAKQLNPDIENASGRAGSKSPIISY